MPNRFPVFVCAAAVCCFAQVSTPGDAPAKAKLEGTVVSATTGAPLKKAIVTLEPESTPDNVVFSVTTDAEGKFVFEDLEPGDYVIGAERVGYVEQGRWNRSGESGTEFELTAGSERKEFVIKLTPQGMIYGKVIDEDGDPVDEGTWHVLRSGFIDGKRQLKEFMAGQLQADGSFVVGGLAPGKYFLSVDGGDWSPVEKKRPGRKGAPEEGRVTTYF
jgi:Carboxypeptidase regulatory-like domain